MKLFWLTSLLQISFEVHSAENRSGPVQFSAGGGHSLPVRLTLDVHSINSTHIAGNKASLLQSYKNISITFPKIREEVVRRLRGQKSTQEHCLPG